jgi:hypothetical protein
MKKSLGIGLAAALLFPVVGWCGADKFVDSKEYKDKDFRSCIISDYTNMVEGDDINWVWKNPDVKLENYKLSLGQVVNKAAKEKSSDTKAVKEAYKEAISDVKYKGKESLVADVCVYEVQEFSYGKAWIPFAGGHQMQAGVGVEVVLKDKGGKAVATFRHFTREGARTEEAAKESAEDITDFVVKN